jgi:HTH-type transcriptional regulator / antitoxin HigA
LVELLTARAKFKNTEDEIELLTLLIEKWEEDHNQFPELDPIMILKSLMEERELKAKDLVSILGVSKGFVSEVLNYKKRLSKQCARMLGDHFKLKQSVFNRPYQLQV